MFQEWRVNITRSAIEHSYRKHLLVQTWHPTYSVVIRLMERNVHLKSLYKVLFWAVVHRTDTCNYISEHVWRMVLFEVFSSSFWTYAADHGGRWQVAPPWVSFSPLIFSVLLLTINDSDGRSQYFWASFSMLIDANKCQWSIWKQQTAVVRTTQWSTWRWFF